MAVAEDPRPKGQFEANKCTCPNGPEREKRKKGAEEILIKIEGKTCEKLERTINYRSKKLRELLSRIITNYNKPIRVKTFGFTEN